MKKVIICLLERLLRLMGYRIVDIPLTIKGIGHQITEPLIIAKRQQLGLIPPHYKFIYLFSINLTYTRFKEPHINYHFLKYIKKYSKGTVFEFSDHWWERLKFKLIAPFVYPEIFGIEYRKSKTICYDVSHYMSNLKHSAIMFETNNYHKKPMLKLSKKDEEYGESILKKMKLSKQDWFVGFHYRDNHFYKGVHFWEENYKNRCVDLDSYELGLREIASQGGWCIRVAAQNSPPMPKNIKSLERVIDVDDIDGDIDRFIIYVLAKSRFFIACNSGPSILAGFFGVPTVQVQSAPYFGAPIHHFDIYIHKKYFSETLNRVLSFEELQKKPICHTNLDLTFQKHKIKIVDNSKHEVLALIVQGLEMTRSSIENKDYCLNELIKLNKDEIYCGRSPACIGKQFWEQLNTSQTF